MIGRKDGDVGERVAMRDVGEWQQDPWSRVAIGGLENDILRRPRRELGLDFSPMLGTDHDQDALAWDESFGAVQRVLEQGAATSDSAELLNASPTTQLGEKLAHTGTLSSR